MSCVSRTWHKAIASMLLLSFCCAVLPIPYDKVEHHEHDSSEAFPCQSCGCGCKTAEQCWTNCCCYTPTERLAWAKKNKVSPPKYAVLSEAGAPDATPIHLTGEDSCESDQSSQCGGGRNASREKKCCSSSQKRETNEIAAASVCCKISGTCTSCSTKAHLSPKSISMKFTSSGKKYRFMLSMLALKCQGKCSAFTQLPWLIPSVRCESPFVDIAIEQMILPVARILVSIHQQPDKPPPKLLSV